VASRESLCINERALLRVEICGAQDLFDGAQHTIF
jgi:hypothetical protein